MTAPVLEFRDVVKRFGAVNAVDGISFAIERGEVFTLLGPSGCGKTTTLRLVAGLEEPDGGEIVIAGHAVAAPARGIFSAPEKRQLGMVFQSYAIWPHLSVFENVAFPLRVRREAEASTRQRVQHALEVVGLDGFAERGATQLSGGQQQRVALARALVYEPALLLLDEPLSNLDAKLREQMRVEIRALQKQLGLTILYVTHDQAEAMTLSDRLAVVNHGRFEQVGAPDMVYEKPASTFVANFLGRMVSFSGRVVSDGTLRRFEFAENAGHATCAEPFAPSENGAAELLTRPEDIEVLEAGALGDGQLNGVVEQVAYLGECFEYQVHTAGISVSITAPKRRRFEVGAAVRLALDPARVTVKTQ